MELELKQVFRWNRKELRTSFLWILCDRIIQMLLTECCQIFAIWTGETLLDFPKFGAFQGGWYVSWSKNISVQRFSNDEIKLYHCGEKENMELTHFKLPQLLIISRGWWLNWAWNLGRVSWSQSDETLYKTGLRCAFHFWAQKQNIRSVSRLTPKSLSCSCLLKLLVHPPRIFFKFGIKTRN